MAISVECDGCSKVLRVKDEYLGKTLKCPDCGVKFVAELPEDNSKQELLDKIVAQWPLAAGVVLLAGGLLFLVVVANTPGAGEFRKLALGIMGLGLGAIGYWALSSSNRDYNF
jgi:hypothetical protein